MNCNFEIKVFSKHLGFKTLALVFILMHTFNSIYAQKVLALDLIGVKLKRVKYYEGDPIAIRINNDKTIYRGELNAISDSSFFINNNYIALDSVEAIIKSNKFVKGISLGAFTVAAVTGVFTILNRTLKSANIPPQDNSYYVPVVFAGLGVALLPFWKKSYRIGKNRILKVIDLSPS